MRFPFRLPHRLWRLFVDDLPFAAALLGWVAVACLVLPGLRIGSWAGPILFAGIAALTFGSLKPRR